MTSQPTNAWTHFFPHNNNPECQDSKQLCARCFDKDLCILLLGLHSVNVYSARFLKSLGPLAQRRSIFGNASSDVNTSHHSVSYLVLERTKKTEDETDIEAPH
jgi:hypothetical protein